MRFGVLFCLLVTLIICSEAQVLPDSIILKKSKENAFAIYNNVMEGNFHIYNGTEYPAYRSSHNEHPYYLTDEWTNGNIRYDGEWFTHMPMLYDIEKGMVVISYYFKGIKMRLNTTRVQEFIFQNHHFVNLKQTADSSEMKSGFYDVLYAGKSTVLCSRSKKYFERMYDNQITQDFQESNQYFLFSQGLYHRVGTKKSVLHALTDKKKELKTFIRKNNLFTAERETSLNRVAAYYDSLKPWIEV